MGAKLSKKKKGYDVSDPKSKNGEAAVTEVAKVEDGAPSTGAESTPGKDGVVEEAVVSAVAAVAEGAAVSEEPKSPSTDEKAPAAEEEATPEQKPAAEESAPVATEQAVAAEQPAPAEKEKAVEAVAEKAPGDPESAPPEEHAATVEVALEQKAAAPVEDAPAAEPNKPSPIEEPAAPTEAAPPAEPEKPEPKTEEPTVDLLVVTAITENSSAPASEEPVQVEAERESVVVPEEPRVEEPPAPVESVLEPDVVLASTEAPLKDQEPEPVQEPFTESEATVEEQVVPEPEAEPAGEPLMKSDTKPEPNDARQETVVVPEEKVQPEQETEPDQPEPESMEAPEPEPEQSPIPEVEQSPEPEQVEEPKPQPTVSASDATDPDSPEPKPSDVLEASAQNVCLENHPANEEPTLPTEAAEPAPEIIISQSVSTSSMTVESDKAALEELTCPGNEAETNLENGDSGSLSTPENPADAVPAVNGNCTDNTAALAEHEEECVNGNEKLEETPVKEQSEFELKKDLCGDVQEVPDAVSDMMEGLITEVTQAV